ncbi:MAG: SUMF1/EgtB/PvdO family nonheme iron enzyme, partial [Chloroflexota bacterium]
GALDMAGNVWEWTSSAYCAYPYRTDDGREPPTAHERRVVRGGVYNHDARHIRCSDRTGLAAMARDGYIGFRVVTSNVTDARARDFDWVEIPAGEFIMGNDARPYRGAALAGEAPQHTITLPEFRIAQTPVTNAEYHEFVNATNHPAPGHWRDGRVPRGLTDHPVTYVDWHDAQAFCRWAGARLPTEAEWEKAARGPLAGSGLARIFPWGNARPDQTRLNYRRNVKRAPTMPVTQYPLGASPYGALDMAGNVWEWVSSLYAPYPYRAADGREDLSAHGQRVLRGGSFASQSTRYVRCAMRSLSYPTRRRDHIGFRVAQTVVNGEQWAVNGGR